MQGRQLAGEVDGQGKVDEQAKVDEQEEVDEREKVSEKGNELVSKDPTKEQVNSRSGRTTACFLIGTAGSSPGPSSKLSNLTFLREMLAHILKIDARSADEVESVDEMSERTSSHPAASALLPARAAPVPLLSVARASLLR